MPIYETGVVKRIGFNPDPDPALYVNFDLDPDLESGSQINADLCGSGLWSDCKVTESRIFS
jgi:hypothetical protein